MRFEAALKVVRQEGVAILKSHPELTSIGVGVRGGAAISQAQDRDDFVVQPSVRDLDPVPLEKQIIQKVQAQARDAGVGDRVDIEFVTSAGEFVPRPGLVVPVSFHGVLGGHPPPLDTQKYFQSLRCGIGITNPMRQYPSLLSVGTLGFAVRDLEKHLYLVSNNHVIAHVNAASKGDGIVQPGTLDLTVVEIGCMPTVPVLLKQLHVADLTAWVPIQFPSSAGTPNNKVDLAIAVLRGERPRSDLHRLCYGGSIRAVAPPYQVDPASGTLIGSDYVYKVGRTTGYTEGRVVRLGVVAPITYAPGMTAYFIDQIEVNATADNTGPFSAPGDSGSGVLNNHHKLIGLLFAGTPLKTLVNPIQTVLAEITKLLNMPVEVVMG